MILWWRPGSLFVFVKKDAFFAGFNLLIMPITRPYSPWKLLVNDKRTVSRQTDISLLHNVKRYKQQNELWKTVLSSFPKNHNCIRFNLLQVCPSVPLFLLAVLFIPSFRVLSSYFYVSLSGGFRCLNYDKLRGTASGGDPHLFERLFVIWWENNRDCHITMPLSLKTMEVQIKGDQWNKRFRTVQVYCSFFKLSRSAAYAPPHFVRDEPKNSCQKTTMFVN